MSKAPLECGAFSPGQYTSVKLTQLPKAELPILVTLLPIMTEVKAEQSAKAAPPIVFTLFGIMIEDKAEQLKKANSSIVVKIYRYFIVLLFTMFDRTNTNHIVNG